MPLQKHTEALQQRHTGAERHQYIIANREEMVEAIRNDSMENQNKWPGCKSLCQAIGKKYGVYLSPELAKILIEGLKAKPKGQPKAPSTIPKGTRHYP